MEIPYNTKSEEFRKAIDVLIDYYKLGLELYDKQKERMINIIFALSFFILGLLFTKLFDWFWDKLNSGNYLEILLVILISYLSYRIPMNFGSRIGKKYFEKYLMPNKFDKIIHNLDVLYTAKISPEDKVLYVEFDNKGIIHKFEITSENDTRR